MKREYAGGSVLISITDGDWADGQVWVRDDGDTLNVVAGFDHGCGCEQQTNLDRATVTELRDWLSGWLDG